MYWRDGSSGRRGPEHRLDGGGLEQSLEHTAGTPVLEALVRGQGVLGPVPPVAELAHVECVGLFVLVLEVAFKGVVAAEGAPAVWTLLRFVDASGSGRGHSYGPCNITGLWRWPSGGTRHTACRRQVLSAAASTTLYYTNSGGSGKQGGGGGGCGWWWCG